MNRILALVYTQDTVQLNGEKMKNLYPFSFLLLGISCLAGDLDMNCKDTQGVREVRVIRQNYQIGYSMGIRSITGENDPRYKQAHSDVLKVNEEVEKLDKRVSEICKKR